jgi:DNA-binding MarR family transcriptional regulator
MGMLTAALGALLLGSMLLSSMAFAQPPRRAEGEPRQQLRQRNDDRLVEFLGLTEAQQESWRAAHEAHRESISGVLEQLRDNRTALEEAIEAEDALRVGELTLEGRRLHQEMNASLEGLQAQLAGILDEEQAERWEAFKAAREDGPGFGRRGPRGHRRGPHGPGGV